MFFGDGSQATLDIINSVKVRSVEHFDWTFIFILAVVFCVYTYLIRKKDWKAVIAGLSLYSIHWFYEIMNACIYAGTGIAPLWTVTNESTSFILLIGVCWELSMMFAIAGVLSWKMMEPFKDKKFLAKGKFKGISGKFIGAIGMALLFALIEIFLASTPSFVWYYKWWGFLLVFITTYVPFFLGSNYVPDASPKFQKIFLGCLVSINIILLCVLCPLGII